MSVTVNYYDSTATKIVRTRAYADQKLAWAAIRRAQKRGQIALFAGVRKASDPPTCHH